MKIHTIAPYGYDCNVYVVTGDGKNCILIDCASPRVLSECEKLGLTPKAVLLTHGHFDHIAGCRELEKSGADIFCGEGEDSYIFSEDNISIFGIDIPKFEFKKTFKDGEEGELYGVKFKVIATPGHTAHGVTYLIGDTLFTGDTLFFGSVGRSDFPTGDYETLIASVKKLYALDGDFKVLSGHGEPTTLKNERLFNAFVRA